MDIVNSMDKSEKASQRECIFKENEGKWDSRKG